MKLFNIKRNRSIQNYLYIWTIDLMDCGTNWTDPKTHKVLYFLYWLISYLQFEFSFFSRSEQ